MELFLCRFSASVFRGRFSASIASLLILLFVVPPGAFAKAKPLDAATVHTKILKRGIGNWVCVEENTGVELVGRIISIDAESFAIQLPNDPDPVPVRYVDVIDLRAGPSRGFWILTAAGIGAVTGMAIWGFVHVHNLQQQNQLPNPQPLP
jgi:hypothetical protein